MQKNYQTSRLLLHELNLNDTGFISELVNTPEWIRFIGDRNIRNNADATAYVQKIIDNPDINYWVVKIKEGQIPIGIITFIKRDYLDHYDIGFAFLPRHAKQGYAFEAASAVMNDVIKDPAHTQVLATTIRENINSIQLLQKLGFGFNRDIEREDEVLQLYAVSTDKLFTGK